VLHGSGLVAFSSPTCPTAYWITQKKRFHVVLSWRPGRCLFEVESEPRLVSVGLVSKGQEAELKYVDATFWDGLRLTLV
jgi:hypothetical protein